MKNYLKLAVSLLILFFILFLPKFISIGSFSLSDWQKEHLGWNYIGVSANYIIFFIYWKYSRKSLGSFGVHFGEWRRRLVWFSLITISVLVAIRIIDFYSMGSLSISIPTWSTIIFQFIYVALGEELFYRGYIQSEYGFWTAALTFGLIHYMNVFVNDIGWMEGLIWSIQATGLGIIMGWIRKKTDSIYASALFHGLINLFNHIF